MTSELIDLAEWYEMIEVRSMYNDYYQAERKSIDKQSKSSQNGHSEPANSGRRSSR